MPGHMKRGGTGEPDPDPTEYLFITYEEKQKVPGQWSISCMAISCVRTFQG